MGYGCTSKNRGSLKEGRIPDYQPTKEYFAGPAKGKGEHFSAQQIYERVIDHNPRVNFSTVYRNIEILEDLGILHRIHTGEGYGNFKLNEQNRHHHHFICKLCGKTEAIDFCPLNQLEETLRDRNFIPTEHHFEIFGYCQKCMKDREKEYYE